MLNADEESVLSLRRLRQIIEKKEKQLVFWIGAGASRWLGYSSWDRCARDLRLDFFKGGVGGFDNSHALNLINKGCFPDFFQYCKTLEQERYYRFLSDSFAPVQDTPLYLRFIQKLSQQSPLRIVTTNIDEALEQHLNAIVLQRSDISRSIDLLHRDSSFIGKLHGSRSAVRTAVFATSDYEDLIKEPGYRQTIKLLFANCCIIFFGYGLADDYVISLLFKNEEDSPLFGTGPHFVVGSGDTKETQSLHRISYSAKRHPDHRSAMTVLDFVQQCQSSLIQVQAELPGTPKANLESPCSQPTGYYISDLWPPGVIKTSQTVQAGGSDGQKIEMSSGLGFTNDEIPYPPVSTALHDLIVGLICFDQIYIRASSLSSLHDLLGGGLFWDLVSRHIFKFIYLPDEPGIVFNEDDVIGTLTTFTMQDGAGEGPEAFSDYLRRQLQPVPGKEQEAGRLMESLERYVLVFKEDSQLTFPALVSSSLLMPWVTRLLGIGDAIMPSQAPKWLTYPLLRMAHLVEIGAVCNRYGIQAAKLPFGGVQLTSAAFGVQMSSDFAEECASYVLSGRYGSDLGNLILQQPIIIHDILRFRESADGEAFRKEIREMLFSDSASEFITSINGKRLANHILVKGRDVC